MSEKVTPFNPVDYMETQAEINEYLSEAYRDEDPNIFIVALGNVAKHHGMADTAQETGLNRESLYKTFSGKVKPRWETVHRLLKLFNINLNMAS